MSVATCLHRQRVCLPILLARRQRVLTLHTPLHGYLSSHCFCDTLITKYLLPGLWLGWTQLESVFVHASEKGQRVDASSEKACVVRAVIERLTGMSTARHDVRLVMVFDGQHCVWPFLAGEQC